MNYILLAAGKGSHLHPITLDYPKPLFKLNDDETVIKRTVHLIKKYDQNAEIAVVTGFMKQLIESEIKKVHFCHNPFYSITNSSASLWFAKEYLDAEQVTIINGDIVLSEKLMQEKICKEVNKPIAYLDSSIQKNSDWNVQVNKDKVVVISEDLEEYHGEYAGIIKLEKKSAHVLKEALEEMINKEMYDQWYEDVFNRLIFKDNFNLYYEDISDYQWTEITNIKDLVNARKIK